MRVTLKMFSQIRTSFGSQLILTIGSGSTIIAIGFITSIIIARLLGPIGRGELAAVQLWGTFFGGLALVGVPEAVVYFVGREPQAAKVYILTGVFISFVAGLPIVMIGITLIPYLLLEQRPSVATIAQWFLFLQFVLYILNWIAMSGLRGLQQFDLYNLLRPLPTFGWLIILLFAYIFKVTSVGLLTAAILVSNFISAIVGVYLVNQATPGSFRLNIKLWLPLLRFGLPTMLSLIPNYLVQYGRLSQMVVAAVLSPEALGLIIVAIGWSNITNIVPQSIGQVVFPRIAAMDEDNIRQSEIARATRLTVLLSTAISIFFMLISPVVMPLIYGVEFAPSIVPALIMLLTAIPAALRKVISDILRGLNRPHIALVGELFSLGTAILLMLVFIQPWGIIGVALALLLSEVFSSVVILLLLSRNAQVHLANLLIPTFQDIQTAVTFVSRLRPTNRMPRH